MAKTFFFILGFSGAFCLGQWCALEGYTLSKGIRWAESRMEFQFPSVDIEPLIKRAGLSQLGGWLKQADGVRKVTPVRAIPGEKNRTSNTIASSPRESRASADEEGLSPTDREALLDLLK
jgi:hypothetical protein